MNRLYLERFHYLQSTFLKTKDPTAKAASENYRQMLIQIAAQLRTADGEFRNAATRLVEQISAQLDGQRSRLCAKSAPVDVLQGSRLEKKNLVYETPG